MNYLLDTNILLAYLNKSKLSGFVDQTYQPLNGQNQVGISIVTPGELMSISLQSNWGQARHLKLQALIQAFNVIDINIDAILRYYAEIDVFSQGKLIGKPLGASARNMGKNDLWIAATANYVEATLLTTDKDFNHLNGHFLDVVWLNPDEFK